MEALNENLYSIQFVSNVTGINAHTIRAWEKRYGATSPIRDKNGRRLYSDREIERLNLLYKLVNCGNSISDIANLAIEELNAVLERYSPNPPKNTATKTPLLDVSSIKSNLLMSLNFFKMDVLAHELEKAGDTLPATSFVLEIINPLIDEIRSIKGKGNLNDFEKDQIYLILKSQLIKKMYSTKYNKVAHKKILVASAKGKLNELGGMVAAILFLGEDYEVEYLGGDVDPLVLNELASQFVPDYIFVGLNYSHEISLSIEQKEDYLKLLDHGKELKCETLIGAHDYCFNLPSEKMSCFNSFSSLLSYVRMAHLN